ncbi:MAG: YkgJ family cysteine cluster protein [Limisphaerales bacterium]
MPVFYACDRCTACCRWPGQVKITAAEITRMASHLHLSEDQFIQDYTRLNTDRSGLALTDQPGGECVFLDGQDCRVNAVKPQQCRNFPNLWNFPGFEEVCRAKKVILSEPEYRSAMARVTGVDS